MYRVKTVDTSWQYIVSYRKWTLNSDFMQFTFNDGKILILPLASIKSIEQVSKYKS